jgi:cytochrome P450
MRTDIMARPLPPGPAPHWLLGNLPEFRRDPLAFLSHCARTYGEVACFHILRTPVYLLSNPEHIASVLSTNSRSFVKGRSIRALYPLLGQGLFTAEGDRWLRLRKMNQPAFRPDRTGPFAAAVLDCTRRVAAGWRAGDTLDVYAVMNDLTVRIVARALFGMDFEGDAAEVGAALHSILKQFRSQLDTAMLIPAGFPTPGNLRMRRALRRMEDIVYRVIRERRAAALRADDLLSALMYPEDPATALNDRELRDEVMTFLVAGHETTAVALTWAWYLLSGHPEADSRLASEIDALIGNRPVSLDDLRGFAYARAVLLETLRLYPPAWTTPRVAIADCSIGDYSVPAGTSVTMSQWVMHHDPDFFPDPLGFQPDRWQGGLLTRLPRYAYFPFGGGPRGCVGEPLAMVEALLILITIAQRFRLRPASRQVIEPWPTLTLHPKGPVNMRIEERWRAT